MDRAVCSVSSTMRVSEIEIEREIEKERKRVGQAMVGVRRGMHV